MSRGIHPRALLAAYALTGALPLFFIAWQYDAQANVAPVLDRAAERKA